MTEELKQPLMPTSQPQHLSHTPMDFSVKSESVVPEHEIRTVLRDIHKTDKTIRGHTKKVTTVAAIGNDFIVSGSKDERVKVWSLKNPQQVTTFRGHEGKVNMVAVGSHEVSHGHLAAADIYSASEDRTVKRWRTHAQNEVLTYIGHSDAVLCLDYDPNTRRLASGGADKQIIVWTRDRAEIDFYLSEFKEPEGQEPEAHEDRVNCIKFFDYGRRLASGSSDKRVKVWNLESRNLTQNAGNLVELRNLDYCTEEHDGKVLVLDTFSNVIAAGTCRGTIYIWDGSTLLNKLSIKSESPVLALKFSHNGKFLISNEAEKYFTVWNLDKNSRETSIFVSNERVNALALSQDSSFVVSASDDNCVAVWQLKRSLEHSTFSDHKGPVTSLSTSTSQNSFITGSADRSLRLWNPNKPELNLKIGEDDDEITCLATHNQLCISGSRANTIKLWDISKPSLMMEYKYSHTPKSLQFNPNSNHAVVGFKADKDSKKGKVVLINTDDLEESASFDVDKSVNSVIFLQAAVLTVVAATSAGEVHLHDIDNVHRVVQVHQVKITCMKLNENKGILYTGSVDSTVKVVTINSLTVKATLENFSKVNSIDVGVQGNLLVAGLDDGQVKVWNLKEFREEFTLKMHEAPVLAVGFSFKDRFIVSGSQDSNVKVWATHEKNKQKLVKGLHSRSVTGLAATPDGKYGVSISEDGMLKTWLISNQEVTNCFEAHRKNSRSLNSFLSLVISPDGKRAIVGCSDKRIYVYPIDHLPQSKYLKVLQGHVGEVTGLVVANDNDTLFSCSADGTIRKWSIDRGDELNIMYASEHPLTCLALSHSGVYVYSGDSSGQFKIINSTRFTQTHSQHFSTRSISSIQITKDDSLAILSSKDGKLHIYNLESHHSVYSITLHSSAITSLALSTCNKYIYSGSEDSCIKIWNIQEQFEEFQIKAHNESVTCLHVNAVNGLILSGSKDESINLWVSKDKYLIKKLSGHDRQIFTVTSSSSFIATGSADQSVIVWDYKTMSVKSRITDLPDRVLSLVFALDARSLFIGLANGDIFSCELSQDSKPLRIAGHDEAVTCLIQNKDKRLISASNDHSVKVWDLSEEFKQMCTLNEHKQKVSALAYSEAVEYLASGSADKMIVLWNLKKYKKKASLAGHSLEVQTLAFTHDGRYLISGSNDKTIKVWDVVYRKLDKTLDFLMHPVLSLIVTRDNQHIVYALANQEIQVIPIVSQAKPIEFLKLNCAIKALCLGADEEKLLIANETACLISCDFKNRLKSLGVESKTYEAFIENETKNLMPTNFNNFQSYLRFYNIFYCLKNKEYTKLSPKSSGVQVSKYNFTFTHFLCANGQGKALKDLISPAFVLRPDSFGHSGFHYAIKNNDQESVDVLLEFLVDLGKNRSRPGFFTTFYAIQKDFQMIIKNNSQFLPDFLKSIMYESDKIVYARAKETLPVALFSEYQVVDKKNFHLKFDSHEKDKEKKVKRKGKERALKFLTSSVKIPFVNGTAGSLDLLQSIADCENDEVFKTDFIKYYVEYKYERLKWIGYVLAFLVVLNLGLIFVMINESVSNFWVLVPFLVVNGWLFIWELIQIRGGKLDYFRDPMNLIDGTRLAATGLWVFMEITNERNNYLTWFMVLINLFRGFFSLKVFEGTRVFIRLLQKSFKNIWSFLVVFIYCTVSLGLMTLITSFVSDPSKTQGLDIRFETLWVIPYDMMLGISPFTSTQSNLTYIGFLFISILNWMILMNILIAILSDTYDEFLTQKETINTKEKINLLIEIEQIVYSFTSASNSTNYLHICDKVSKQQTKWKGKVLYLENLLKSSHSPKPSLPVESIEKPATAPQDNSTLLSKLEEIEEKIQNSRLKTESEIGKLARIIQSLQTTEVKKDDSGYDNFAEKLTNVARESYMAVKKEIESQEFESKIGEIRDNMTENFRQSTSVMNTVRQDMMKISDNLKKKNDSLKKENENMTKIIEEQLVKNRRKIDESIKSKIEEKMSALEMNIQNKINGTIAAIDKRVAETVQASEVSVRGFINEQITELKEFIRAEVQIE